MSYKQPPNSANNVQVPSWDEFNLTHEEEHTSAHGFGNGPIYEPGHPEEFGPNLPPGFIIDESQQEDSNSIGINCEGTSEDFSIPIENYDLDDPEDPLQGGASSQKKPHTLTLNANNQPTVLPKLEQQKSDEQCALPSLSIAATQFADFVPMDQRPCSSSTLSQCSEGKVIGPAALPPDFIALTARQIIEYDIGTALPPDEPQCSIDRERKKSIGANIHRKQKASRERMNIGPTLPSSSDDEEAEHNTEENEEERNNSFGKGKGTEGKAKMDQKEEETVGPMPLMSGKTEEEETVGPMPLMSGKTEEEETVGPMPPMPGKTEEEEYAEYLGRLAQCEFDKHTRSKELRREEWMTELPQKMLKTGAFGLTAKNSFSRQSSDTSALAQKSDLWTKMPNGDQKKSNVAVPSIFGGTSDKRAENEQREQRRAEELNKERNQSLLEMHQKKRKIDNAPSSSSTANAIITASGERRPFDRDTEIEGRCFRGKTNAGESEELKERMGGDLSNRFGHASDRKFL